MKDLVAVIKTRSRSVQMSPSGRSTFRASLLKFFASTESNRNGLMKMTLCLRGQTERLTMLTTCGGLCLTRRWIGAVSHAKSGVMAFTYSGTRQEASYTRRWET
jgi:hypothetical protein